jgi:hypothetical protein
MDKLRLATAEEVQAIHATSDLGPGSSILAFDCEKTGRPDLAVFKQVSELDPVLFQPDTSTRRRALFIWALENSLRLMGTPPAYYFNVLVDDEEWQKNVESWGAIRVSTAPEYRYKKVL